MRDIVKYPVLPDLSHINFSDPSDVRGLIRARYRNMFGTHDDGFIDEYMEAVESLFAGHHPKYQAMDTAYHDINHTLQATLCLAELINNRHVAGDLPLIGPRDFKRGLVAILFHDIGYLKTRDDIEGTGAKYTHVHEQRSCCLVEEYLSERGWIEDDILFVQNLISATGPRADVTKIEFRSEVERALGQAVCTADYVGQMSDPDYPEKLAVLYTEFEESFRYQGMPKSEWPFTSHQSLLRGTEDFWKKFVRHKMTVECGGIWMYLTQPISGTNQYIEAIEHNVSIIAQRIAEQDQPQGLMRESGAGSRC
jgi:hypothetical protein